MDLIDRIRTRLLPALLTALGISFIAAGLLTYTEPVDALIGPTIPPDVLGSASASPSSLPTLPPTPGPSGAAAPTERHTVTRVVVPALNIDLPVIAPPGDPNAFPPCNVALYIPQLHQPGEPGATYIYAHARKGMFLPILNASYVNNGRAMIGMIVQAYTDDDMLFLYEVKEVRRHVTALDQAFGTTKDSLWLQTSETTESGIDPSTGRFLAPVNGVYPKTQVIAVPLSSGPADPAEAHPKPKPVFCG